MLDEARGHRAVSGPLPPLNRAWDLLDRVQQKSPADLDAVLTYPYVGNWAGHTLRRLRGRGSESSPLWVHVGHLHSVAAAASIRAGLDVQVQVPVRNGMVALPTLGTAHLTSMAGTSVAEGTEASVAEVCSTSGHTEIRWGETTIRLPDNLADDAPGWSGLRRLAVASGQHTLSLLFEDLDPYRGLYGPRQPDRVEIAEVRAWQRALEDAWRLICRHLPQQAGAMRSVLNVLVPVPAPGRFQVSSASSGEAFGGVVMSRPESPAILAATLVHEYQHIMLGGLLHLVALHDNAPEARFYAPWRDDPRPVGGLLQGIYAFFGVTRFWRALYRAQEEGSRRTAAFEFARWRAATCQALDTLKDNHSLTVAGRRVLQQIEGEIRPWLKEPVPEDIAAAVETVGRDHQVAWRLHHLQPDVRTVAQVSHAWLITTRTGAGPARGHNDLSPDALVPDAIASWLPTRSDLIRCQVIPPEAGACCPELESEASAADRAFAAGDYAEAWMAYRSEITASRDSSASWVGFALAWASLDPHPGAELLLRRPALVRDVYCRLRSLDVRLEPDELAAWIAARWPLAASGHG
ncbi:HEXXH motif domain-containing protein [Streptomyces sp. MMG1533]|uniref:HEXXH motif domain-containing protein n=1 Tax=Streptomyces sp. MMG1533 TaxID=1415546 RepID=UPI001F25BC5F|nr:HEXXH motif domain-containing protein [Streptomyces sp. MMG1533]